MISPIHYKYITGGGGGLITEFVSLRTMFTDCLTGLVRPGDCFVSDRVGGGGGRNIHFSFD